VSFTGAGEQESASGVTKNISSGGVLFVSDRVPEVGDTIEYVITLRGEGQPTLKLHCVGKVVRREVAGETGSGAAVAVTLDRYKFLREQD